jgi:hypothetical protein
MVFGLVPQLILSDLKVHKALRVQLDLLDLKAHKALQAQQAQLAHKV